MILALADDFSGAAEVAGAISDLARAAGASGLVGGQVECNE